MPDERREIRVKRPAATMYSRRSSFIPLSLDGCKGVVIMVVVQFEIHRGWQSVSACGKLWAWRKQIGDLRAPRIFLDGYAANADGLSLLEQVAL